MYVPNYIPEPLEVPGNITLRPYSVRIQFIRQVVGLHSAGLAVVALAYLSAPQHLATQSIVIALLCLLALLDLLRIRLRGTSLEAKVSSMFLPIIFLMAGWSSADLARHGWPSTAAVSGGVAVMIYTLASGRDFSFVGCFFLSWIASSLAILGLGWGLNLTRLVVERALLVNFVYLGYTTYDLASLMARRRQDEQLAAVVDLYRDMFNFIGYFWRCLHHWRKHKIWVIPK